MQTSSSEPQDIELLAAPSDEGDAIVHLATVLRVMLFLGLAIVLLGAAVGLARDGELPTATVDLSHVPGEVARFHPEGILTLALLTFLSSPIVVLIYLFIAFMRVRERVFAGVSAVVFGIILASFVIARFS